MKRSLLLLALVLVSTAVSARPLAVKNSDNQIYITGALKGKNNLEKMGINLAGLLDTSYSSKPVSYFDLAVVFDKDYKSASVMVAITFSGRESTVYSLTLNSVGRVKYEKRSGAFSFSAKDLLDELPLLEVTGTIDKNGTSAILNMKDPAMPVPFAYNTPLMLVTE